MSSRQLSIDVETSKGVSVVVLEGSVDASNVTDLQEALEKVCGEAKPLVLLDCRDLAYVNSASFGLFFRFHRACARRDGKLVICSLKSKISNIIKLLGLDKFLDTFPDRKTALAALKEQASA